MEYLTGFERYVSCFLKNRLARGPELSKSAKQVERMWSRLYWPSVVAWPATVVVVAAIGPQQCKKVRFASFFSGGFVTAIVVNPPESKLTKHTFSIEL